MGIDKDTHAVDVKGAKALAARLAGANVGDRVYLISTSGDHDRLSPGAEGTVALVDETGSIHVKWDAGGESALVVGQDFWRTRRTAA